MSEKEFSEHEFRDQLIRTIRRREKVRKARKKRREYRLVVVVQTDWNEYTVIGPYGEKMVHGKSDAHSERLVCEAVAAVGGIYLNMFDKEGRQVG